MQKAFSFSILIMLAMFQYATAQNSLIYESGGELIPGLAAYDVHFYELNLEVNPADSTVYGTVDIHFKTVHPSNNIALALDPKLEIQRVQRISQNGLNEMEDLGYARDEASRTFFVNFKETLQPGDAEIVRVAYGGVPKIAPNPPWDGGMVWSRTPSDDPWVGVAVQTTGAWLWWPNKDHPSDRADSVAINITMPDDLIVASNGHLRGETDRENGWKTWHWFVSTPINNYNVTLNAAPYETISEPYTSISGDEFDITFWVLPEFLEQGEELFPQFAEQIRHMEEVAGPYPFRADKYGVAHAPYLGMEHQTIIAYGANFQNDILHNQNLGFDDLHQHELAHEWWGNLVAAWDWRDFWVHEGLGTYMQALYAEHIAGKEAYHNMMAFFKSRIVMDADREVAPRESMSTRDITQGARGGNVYFKGAWFLHTLRYVIGDDHFFELLRRFAYPDLESENVTDGSHMRFAATDDFLHMAEKITGMDLKWLFDVYLRQPAIPELHATRRAGFVRLEWRAPGGYSFPMPLQMNIGGERVTLVPEERGVILLEVDDYIEVEADPDEWILKTFELRTVDN